MKRTSILANAGAVAFGLSLLACVFPAIAQGSNVGSGGFTQQMDINKLQPARFTPSRRKIQIVDETPEVTDCRTPKTSQQVLLQIAPMAPAQTQTSVIQVPGNGAGNGQGTASGGTPGTVLLDLSRPPKSGFTTNIPAGGLAPAKGLQNGTTTNRLMGADANARGKMNAPVVTIKKGDLLRNTAKPSAAPTQLMMKYQDNDVATGSAGSQKTVKTNVSGTMKSPGKRGEYLKPPQ